MTISQILNTSPSVADFICDYWGLDHCDPDSWTHPVSTFGVEGVVLGDKKMILWEDTNPSPENRGRKYGTDAGKVLELVDDIDQNGIDTKCAVGYIDKETRERIGTNHRYKASERLGIPGWMLQEVDFSNCEDPEWAREVFARVINNERCLRQNNNDPEDVEQMILYGIENGNITTDKQIEQYIHMTSNNSFGKQKQKTLINSMLIKLHLLGNDKSSLERYITLNDGDFQDLVDRSEDSYVTDIIKDTHQNHLFINYGNWGSRTNSVLTQAAESARKDGPLHTTVSVGKPTRNESLQTKREKVFDTGFKNLEDDLNVLFQYKFRNGFFPWRHPKCQHTMVPQDTHNEDLNTFIRWSI